MSVRITQIIKEHGFMHDNDLYELAEIIVRECADLVDSYQDMRNPASTYKRLLLEDFGLEKGNSHES